MKTLKKVDQKEKRCPIPLLHAGLSHSASSFARPWQAIGQEGMENVWKRHAGLAKATRAGVEAIGLKLFAPKAPSNALTAVISPDGIDSGLVNKTFRDTYGISIAPVVEKKVKSLPGLTHLGYVDGSDVFLGIATLEMVV